jgi:hypothetical protein
MDNAFVTIFVVVVMTVSVFSVAYVAVCALICLSKIAMSCLRRESDERSVEMTPAAEEESLRESKISVLVESPDGHLCIGVENDLDVSKKMSCNSQI